MLCILMKSHLSILSFIDCAFGVIFKKYLPVSMVTRFPPLSSRSLKFLCRTHFELSFVYETRFTLKWTLLHMDTQMFQHHLLKRLSFLHWIPSAPLSRINCPWLWACFWTLLFQWCMCMLLLQYHTVLNTNVRNEAVLVLQLHPFS